MAQLDEIFAEQFAATGVAGLAGAVRIGDGVWTGSTGVVDLETGEPFRADDFVRIASITKTVTATAVLQLVDEGAVALDDLLEVYVPGVINGDVATLADLLGMTSGIPDFTANEAFGERFSADPTHGLVRRGHVGRDRRGVRARLRARREGRLLRLQLRPAGHGHPRGDRAAGRRGDHHQDHRAARSRHRRRTRPTSRSPSRTRPLTCPNGGRAVRQRGQPAPGRRRGRTRPCRRRRGR